MICIPHRRNVSVQNALKSYRNICFTYNNYLRSDPFSDSGWGLGFHLTMKDWYNAMVWAFWYSEMETICRYLDCFQIFVTTLETFEYVPCTCKVILHILRYFINGEVLVAKIQFKSVSVSIANKYYSYTFYRSNLHKPAGE